VLASTSRTVDIMADDLMMMLRGFAGIRPRRSPRLHRDLGSSDPLHREHPHHRLTQTDSTNMVRQDHDE
jgi:hypothetical protein